MKPKRNGLVMLLAWVLTLGGLAGWSLLLDVPWIRSSGAPAWAGVGIGGLLALRVLARRPGWLLATAAVLQILLAGTFVSWMLWLSSLPGTERFDGLERVPGFRLQDQDGAWVDLEVRLLRGPVLLVFFRGWW